MKTNIVDVAKAWNDSVATLTSVKNRNYTVKEETKEKVLKVIEELQYQPNTQARDLIKKQSSTIGVVVPSISNMFFTNVINGIESYFEKSDYSIFLCITEHDKDKEISRINELISRNVAGIIVVDPGIDNVESKYFDKIATVGLIHGRLKAEEKEDIGITVELGKMYGSYGKHMKYPEKLYEKELF